jgi:hypothetical protein
MIKVNSVDISTPSTFDVSINDIVKADRDAHGNMMIEKIATKRKLEMTWKYLSQSAASTLLSAVSTTTFFTVEYPDPLTGALRSGTFYCGDRSVGMIDYQASTPRYKDIKFNFIEQ